MPAAWRVQMKTSNAIARFFICFALVLIAIMFFVSNATGTAVPKSYRLIHTFTGGSDGSLPTDIPVLDAAGNLYGTSDGGCGNVFKFTRRPDGSWVQTVLYSFDCSAAGPYGGVVSWLYGSLFVRMTACGTVGRAVSLRIH